MTSSSSDIGRMVHDRLLAEGGFCWDHRGECRETITVHMNKGRAMSAALRALLKRHGAELKAYVFGQNDQRRRMEAEAAARWAVMCGRAAPRGVGSSATATPPPRTRDGAGVRDCNAGTGSNMRVSACGGSPLRGRGPGAGRRGCRADYASKVDFARGIAPIGAKEGGE